MKIQTEFAVITFAHICVPRQQFKVFQRFQLLECRPLEQLSLIRVRGHMSTTVKVRLSSIHEQNSLCF